MTPALARSQDGVQGLADHPGQVEPLGAGSEPARGGVRDLQQVVRQSGELLHLLLAQGIDLLHLGRLLVLIRGQVQGVADRHEGVA